MQALQYVYHQTPNISRTSVGNKIVDHSDDITPDFNGGAKTTARRNEKI